MARPGPPDSARVLIGLDVSEADAARMDEVLARPEFAGWTRSEWCREIIRTALRYYVGDASAPGPGPASASARRAAPQPVPPGQPVPSAATSPAPAAVASGPAVPSAASGPAPAPPEPSAQDCPHPPEARDYDTGTCAACGAIMWD